MWKSLGEYIKSCREKVDLTQVGLAKKFKFRTGQQISDWERDIAIPTKKTLGPLMHFLDLDAEIVTDFLLQSDRPRLLKELTLLRKDLKRSVRVLK